MACPTCDHTMQAIPVTKGASVSCSSTFWCPRCGTLKASGAADSETPTLVGRVRGFIQRLDEDEDEFETIGDVRIALHRHSITESVKR